MSALDPASIPDVSTVCSVYRPQAGIYDYYRVTEPPPPRRAHLISALGFDLNSILPLLPAGARKLGEGPTAVGTIAVATPGTPSWQGVATVGTLLAGALILWWITRPT